MHILHCWFHIQCRWCCRLHNLRFLCCRTLSDGRLHDDRRQVMRRLPRWEKWFRIDELVRGLCEREVLFRCRFVVHYGDLLRSWHFHSDRWNVDS